MKARIERVNVYYDQDIMLVAPAEEMANYACYMPVTIHEAEQKAYEDGRIHTAKHYAEIAQQFDNIYKNIRKEE